MTDKNDDRLLSQKELAARWNVTPRTLQNWHKIGKGPKRVKIGRTGYRLSDVVAYEDAQVEEPGEQAPPTREFKEEHRAIGAEVRKRNREAKKNTP